MIGAREGTHPLSKRAASAVDILPRPQSVTLRNGAFRIRDHCRITVRPPDDPAARAAAGRLASTARTVGLGDWRLADATAPVRHPQIELVLGAGRSTEQGYELRVRTDGVRLTATDASGLRFGVETLRQLIRTGCPAVQAMDVADRPDFPVRGVMLDISRNKVPTPQRQFTIPGK